MIIRLAPLVVIGLTLASQSTPASADANLNCDAYAAAAIQHQTENTQNGCGFTGGRWSMDYAAHLNWCRSAGVAMANLTFEDRARADALAQCIASNAQAEDSQNAAKQEEVRCGLYALSAVSLIPRHSASCSVVNGTPTKEDLKANCLQTGSAAAMDYLKKIGDEVEACESRGTACQQYAAIMSQKARDNVTFNCGLTGGAHADDYDGHYQWCLGVPQQESTKISATVTKQVDDCRAHNVQSFEPTIGFYSDTAKKKRQVPYHVCNRPSGSGRVCGEENANLYCRNKGFSRSARHETSVQENRSGVFSADPVLAYYQSTKTGCTEESCPILTEIVCVR